MASLGHNESITLEVMAVVLVLVGKPSFTMSHYIFMGPVYAIMVLGHTTGTNNWLYIEPKFQLSVLNITLMCYILWKNHYLKNCWLIISEVLWHSFVTSLVECYKMVLAIIMSVPENVWDECYRTCSRYLHKCYWAGYCCAQVTYVTLSYSLYTIVRK